MHFKVLIDIILTVGGLIINLNYAQILFQMFLLLINVNVTIPIFLLTRNLIKLQLHPPGI